MEAGIRMEDSMRAIATFALAVSFAAVAADPPARSVDLDRPGALSAIEGQDKPLYERIQGVLKSAEIEPCDSLPKLIQAQFRAGLETCNGQLILTSYPAKIRITFRIDDTLYAGNVIQPKITARAQPAVAVSTGAAEKR
jgi:hypothetical protein